MTQFPHLDAATIDDLRDQAEGDHELFLDMCRSANDYRAREAARRAGIDEWNRNGAKKFWADSASGSVLADYAAGNVVVVEAG